MRRSFYEQHGGFRTDLNFALDLEFWARCISRCGGVISPQILACYRVSDGNETSRLIRSAEALDDHLRMNRIFEVKYPDFDPKRADRTLCRDAITRAESFAQCGDYSAANANLKFWRKHAPITLRMERLIRNIVRRALP